MFSSMVVAGVLIGGLSFVMYAMSSVYFKSREKSSPYECGFEPFGNARGPFTLYFFLICILFLIFDVETALLMGLPLSSVSSNISACLGGCLFLLILCGGLGHEWRQGTLDWAC